MLTNIIIINIYIYGVSQYYLLVYCNVFLKNEYVLLKVICQATCYNIIFFLLNKTLFAIYL